MLKKIAIAFTVIAVIFAFIPMDVIEVLGKFAIGWMVMDFANYFMKEA